MNQQIVADAVTVALTVVAVLALLKPLLDTVPVINGLPNPAYNSFYQLLGFGLNLCGLVGYEAANGRLNFGPNWYLYVAAALLQMTGSHVIYTKIKGAALASRSSLLVASVAPLTPLIAPVAPAVGTEANAAHSGASMAPAPVAPPAVVNPAPVNPAVLSTPAALPFPPSTTTNPAAGTMSVSSVVVASAPAPDGGSTLAAVPASYHNPR